MDFKLFGKMSLYVFITTLITFVSLVDTLDVHHLDQISSLDWIKMFLKSLVPGLISLKAFLDTSINDRNNQNTLPQNTP